eukprot:CAMPEP_0176184674 /NCGR_PEP_ID=MMETSP0121_2-20121125/943_1 /TAXON_ID=160619 /ORGANISM="Kryptoperidinium foliaceum, Strain CCMP 1326" /LENGTH=169 /DNA_ID=CAMNT_0017523069 /DNA_START=9 /DNA_END=520 /DNA_ORIENTATION=+
MEVRAFVWRRVAAPRVRGALTEAAPAPAPREERGVPVSALLDHLDISGLDVVHLEDDVPDHQLLPGRSPGTHLKVRAADGTVAEDVNDLQGPVLSVLHIEAQLSWALALLMTYSKVRRAPALTGCPSLRSFRAAAAEDTSTWSSACGGIGIKLSSAFLSSQPQEDPIAG